MDIALEEDINKLKESFKDEDPSSLKQIEQWEADIIKLRDSEKFSQFSTTQAIVAALSKRLKDVVRIRAIGKIDHVEMKAYDARREELKIILNLLCPGFENELQEIHRQIVEELSS